MTRTQIGRSGAMRTITLDAVCVQRQGMAVQREAALPRDRALPLLDFGIVEFLDASALQAHEVVVVATLAELEHRLAGLEMLAREQPRLLELGEHTVDGGEPDVDSFRDQRPVHILGGEVAHLAVLEQLENLAARQRRLETHVLETLRRAHRDVMRNGGGALRAIITAFSPAENRFPVHPLSRALILAAPIALAACGAPNMIKPYRMEIQQGNYISQEVVSQLKLGMSKEQVRFILGTPLVTDIFHADRWDYVYFRDVRGRAREERRIAVVFEDGKLARVLGDVVPAARKDETAAVKDAVQPPKAPAATPEETKAEQKEAQKPEPQSERGFFGRLLEKLGF